MYVCAFCWYLLYLQLLRCTRTARVHISVHAAQCACGRQEYIAQATSPTPGYISLTFYAPLSHYCIVGILTTPFKGLVTHIFSYAEVFIQCVSERYLS